MTYAYICGECDHTFDRTLLMIDRELPFKESCPACDMNGYVRRNFIGERFSAIDPVRLGRVKPDREFRNHLDNIHKNYGTAKEPTAGSAQQDIHKKYGSLWKD